MQQYRSLTTKLANRLNKVIFNIIDMGQIGFILQGPVSPPSLEINNRYRARDKIQRSKFRPSASSCYLFEPACIKSEFRA